jgi:hypothetical protein
MKEDSVMAKKSKLEMVLYTLCLEGTAIAICAVGREALKQDAEGTLRAAFFETWCFGGGDLRQLVGRALMARPPTQEEGEAWDDVTSATGKPFVVLAGGGEAIGTARSMSIENARARGAGNARTL